MVVPRVFSNITMADGLDIKPETLTFDPLIDK